jgi:hypothetical protein
MKTTGSGDAMHLACRTSHTRGIVDHMKITLVIDDTVLRRLRQEAAKRGVTMSMLVEAGLRRVLDEPTASREPLPALPRWNGGGARVDIADRDALYALLNRA